MDFRTTVVKTLLGEEIDKAEMLDEEFLSLMEDNPFDELSNEALLEFMDSSLFQLLDEKLAKASYVSAMRNATDSDRIVARAKKVHGDKFANQLSKIGKTNKPSPYKNMDKLGQRAPMNSDDSPVSRELKKQSIKHALGTHNKK